MKNENDSPSTEWCWLWQKKLERGGVSLFRERKMMIRFLKENRIAGFDIVDLSGGGSSTD